MADAMGHLDNIVREELPRVINESLPAIAPIYSQIQSTSIDVTRDTTGAAGIGRGWKVIHLFSTGLAGLIQNANPAGPAMTSITGSQAGLLGLGTAADDVAIFPKAERAPHTSSLKRELTLHMTTGNFNIPVVWLQTDKLEAAQIKQVARDIKEVGNLHALVEAASFFHATANDGTYDVTVLGRISSIAENGTLTDYIDIVLDTDYGRCHNFRPGQVIDIVADSSGEIQTGTATDGTDVRNYEHTTEHYVQLTVVMVDYLTNTITLAPTDTVDGGKPNYGSGSSGDIFQNGQAAAADDWLVLANTTANSVGRPMMSWGLEDWIKSSGKLMGGGAAAEALDLTYYPQFKSQVVTVNGPLTETVMNNYIGGYLDAYPGQSLDTIISTQGISLKYLEQPSLYNNRYVYERTGKALDVAGGWSKITYSFNGRDLQWVISPMCLTGRLYGLKLKGGNIKRYVPPRVGGSDSRVSAEIEFLAPVAGHTGIFMTVVDSSGNPLSYVQAPFWQYKLVAPVDPRGVKLTGLTEATMV